MPNAHSRLPRICRTHIWRWAYSITGAVMTLIPRCGDLTGQPNFNQVTPSAGSSGLRFTAAAVNGGVPWLNTRRRLNLIRAMYGFQTKSAEATSTFVVGVTQNIGSSVPELSIHIM